MFEEILNVPAHPLIVHAAVVFIPLQVLVGYAYALVPFTRKYVTWLVVTLAVVAPGAAYAAKLSGAALRERLIRRGVTNPGILAAIDQHRQFGDRTVLFSLALGVLMVLLVVLLRRGGAASTSSQGARIGALILQVGIVAVGVVAGYFVFKSGHSGATMVWT